MIGIHIVKPGVELVTPKHLPNWQDGFEGIIEECGRVCYQSEAKKNDTPDKFISRIRNREHLSVLEHGVFTVKFTCSRTASHQLVRHRLAAYCVTGDTEIVAHSKTGQSPKRWTIKQLYEWQFDHKRKGRIKLLRARSVDSAGRIVKGKIKKIVETGIQQVFRVKTRCGRILTCTENERFLTEVGWMRLKNLQVGDRVKINGSLAYRDREWVRHHYLVLNKTREEVASLAGVSSSHLGKWIAKFGLQKPKSQYPGRKPGHGVPGMHEERGRLAISKRMTGSGNHRWSGDSPSEQAGRVRAQKTFEIDVCDCCANSATSRHHVDGNTGNNSADNVVPLCDACHASHHTGASVLAVHATPIVSILASGIEQTFDVVMDTEDESLRNYVANGFVLHNSQESQRFCDYSRDRLQDVSVWGDDPDESQLKGRKLLKVIMPPTIGEGLDGKAIFRARPDYEPQVNVDGQAVSLSKWLTSRGVSAKSAGDAISWCSQKIDAYDSYLHWVKIGVPAEDARFDLPNACKTTVATTYNFRMWRHVLGHPKFGRALNKKAQWEIKGITLPVLHFFRENIPSMFSDLDPEAPEPSRPLTRREKEALLEALNYYEIRSGLPIDLDEKVDKIKYKLER